jgi:hypothetical protein
MHIELFLEEDSESLKNRPNDNERRKKMRRTLKLRFVLLSASLCFACLMMQSAAYAITPVIDELNPAEGTIGTTFTITGTDFGTKKGTVFIGSKPSKVLEWSDTKIQCLINVPVPPGEYDVTLNFHGKLPKVILELAFAIMPPMLNMPSHRPQFVNAGDVITVEGAFLGGQKGLKKVEIESLDGKRLPCHLLDGGMDYIMFELPDGIPGRFHLIYTNAVGTSAQSFWGTFAEPPKFFSPVVGDTWHHNSNDNAAAVSYNNKLWIFWPEPDSDGNKINYVRFDGSNFSSVHTLAVGGSEETYAQLTPIVAYNTLYVFYTGTNKGLYYDTYDAGAVDPDKAWTHNRIPDATMASSSGRFAAVWNFTKNCIEIYWTPSAYEILMKTYDLKTGQWSAESKTILNRTSPEIAPYLSAVFNQIDADEGDYVTYLAWADAYNGVITELKDGVWLHNYQSSKWRADNPLQGPSLVDEGEKYLYVLYHNEPCSTCSYILDKISVYDKQDRYIVNEKDINCVSPQMTKWTANGVVFSKKVDDDNSPTGYRMDTNFYALVENNPVMGKKGWYLIAGDYLGYWMPVGEPEYVDLGLDGTELVEDSFPNWPVIGVIDMPPFVLNGNPECSDRLNCGTKIAISFSQSTTEGIYGSYSAGAYISTTDKTQVVFDASAGYSGGFENSTTYKCTDTQTLWGNVDGTIVAFYLAPAFNVYTLEWFDLDNHPTGITTPSLEVTGAQIVPREFKSEAGPDWYTGPPPYLDPSIFPIHGTGEDDWARLATYNIDPTDDLHGYEDVFNDPITYQGYWSLNSTNDFTWSITQDNSVDNGFYADLKFGYNKKNIPIGLGVKGSVKILIKSKVQTGVEAANTFKNQQPSEDSTAVTEFYITGYWLKPEPKGYWVPENRKEMGDAPWFITYKVTIP